MKFIASRDDFGPDRGLRTVPMSAMDIIFMSVGSTCRFVALRPDLNNDSHRFCIMRSEANRTHDPQGDF
jgi:hypothetical protein